MPLYTGPEVATEYKKRVMELFERALASEQGFADVINALDGIPLPNPHFTSCDAQLLDAIAHRVLPRNVEYVVQEIIGGPPEIFITRLT